MNDVNRNDCSSFLFYVMLHCAFISSVLGSFSPSSLLDFYPKLFFYWCGQILPHSTTYICLSPIPSNALQCTWANTKLGLMLCFAHPDQFWVGIATNKRHVSTLPAMAVALGLENERDRQPKYYENISSLAINDVIVAHCHWMRHCEYLVRLELPQTWTWC